MDDEFFELAPAKAAKVLSPIVFSTVCLRGEAERVSLSFSESAIGRLEGWPRFAIAWSPRTFKIRIRADQAGAYEAYRTQKGERYILRFALPRELRHVAKLKEPAPHLYDDDGRTLFITAPPAFQVRALPKPIDAAALARQAVPAPNFSTRR